MKTKISETVFKLAENGGGVACYPSEQIDWDVSLEEARESVYMAASIIPEGWDEPIAGMEQIQVFEVGISPGMTQIAVHLSKD